MTTAPPMSDFAKTVNAVGIRSTAGLERPALKPNKINALTSLKINENSCCIRQAVAIMCGQTVRHKQTHWEKTKVKTKTNCGRREAKQILAKGGKVWARALKGYLYAGDEYEVNDVTDLANFNIRPNRGCEFRNAECYQFVTEK
jgi:hypothetical protein